MGVFLIVLLLSGIVSVSSMVAGIAFPVLLFLFFDTPSVLFKLFSIIISIALVVTHRKNIRRIWRGEEPRLIKYKKKNKDLKD
jgi:glycerol-3-phosphate acyltransferase PlsY